MAHVNLAGAPGSAAPGGSPTVKVPGQWFGEASVLPVIAQLPGWVEVRLAQRPNESVAWVPAGDVSLASDAYHIVINLENTHLQLFKRGQLEAHFPIGVGLPAYPDADRPLLRGPLCPGAIARLRALRDRNFSPQQRHQ